MGRKGQAATEFILILGVLLLVFLILYQYMLSDLGKDLVDTQTRLSARSQAEEVMLAVSEVYIAGDGSNVSFYLDPTLEGGHLYNLTVYDSGLVGVEYQGRLYTLALPTLSVNETTLGPGTWVAKNVRGGVFFV